MKVVLANGVFDLLHYGHLLHLEAAGKLGDKLVVSITQDVSVKKGPGRPIYNEFQRSRLVAALRCVDDVMICESLLEALAEVKPDILVKGIDYRKGLDPEHTEYCEKHGIKIVFTESPKLSATELIHESRCRAGIQGFSDGGRDL
jgi:rfaE bifunctional protein nucleotidyltransferase chain/domain